MKLAILALFLFAAGCGGNTVETPVTVDPQNYQDELIARNKNAVKMENHDIDLFVARKDIKVTKSGRGVQYALLRDIEGPTAKANEWATVNYRVELLNGDTAYFTEPGKPESFLIEMDDVESGLHEGIQAMSPGDSAVIIIPSYRAHGLSGDQDRIPMRSTVVYYIGLVRTKKNDQ